MTSSNTWDARSFAGGTPPQSPGALWTAVDVDMNAISDTVMTLAFVALFARGITRIRNEAHIRHKETDRIGALAVELRKLARRCGRACRRTRDLSTRRRSGPARIKTYDDHRMAMSFALAGLKASGVTILDPGCVAKTYPAFWEDLGRFSA